MSQPNGNRPAGNGQAPSGIAAAQGSRAPAWVVLTLVCLGQFMVVLDISVVNVALPSIQKDLGFSAAGLQWVVNAYTLAFAGFLLLGGRAADLYGRRKMFIVGLTMFSLASLVGGFAQTKGMLIGARAVQGLGGAVLAPATLTILVTSFAAGRERARALGVWSAMAAAGGAAGAILGGVLTDLLSWRWILFINVPIGLAAAVAARAILVETRAPDANRTKLDIAGSVTVTAALVSLVFGIVETESHGWSSPWTIVPIVISAVLLAAFIWIETRVATTPLMPFGLFRSRSVRGANICVMFLGAAMFSMWFFLSLYMQDVLGYTPLQAGIAFLPQTAMIVIGAQIAARTVAKIGPRPLLVLGGTLAALGLAWYTQISPHGTYVGDLLFPGLLVTLGLGLCFMPVTMAATTGVDPRDAGLASGLVNTTRQVGGSIGLAALATISTAVITAQLAAGEAPKVAATAGYARAFAVGAVICVVAAAAGFLVPSMRRPREGAPATTRMQPAPAPVAEA
ncbi:MAG TPA: MFS transporter [Actinomycetota bacterium]|nr:MFS transporter [Actinomycetota bacterium]